MEIRRHRKGTNAFRQLDNRARALEHTRNSVIRSLVAMDRIRLCFHSKLSVIYISRQRTHFATDRRRVNAHSLLMARTCVLAAASPRNAIDGIRLKMTLLAKWWSWRRIFQFSTIHTFRGPILTEQLEDAIVTVYNRSTAAVQSCSGPL